MKKERKYIFYDIETDNKVKISGKGYKKRVVNKGTITSVAFKEIGKSPVAFTIGYNCNNLKELKQAIKTYLNNKEHVLVAWNGAGFDDLLIKAHLGRQVKCKFFDIMQGYSKFVLNKKVFISLNSVSNEIGHKKDDVNPITAYKNKEFKLLYDYNIKDVVLLDEINKKFEITNVLDVLLSTTQLKEPNKIFGVTAPLKSYIEANNISIGNNANNNLLNWGAINYYKSKGQHNNLIHYDVRSFYPYMFVALNASSNLDYNNLEIVKLSDVDGLKQYGSLYFNEDGTLQVKKEGDKYIGLKLKGPFNLKDGNTDIKGLVSNLVEYKGSTSGNLRNAYKILVNGLYGALSYEYFDYHHNNLSAVCTFMCRLVLYNCIKKFNGIYAKTDSIWLHNATEEDLNNYTASLLDKYDLHIYDTNGDYLIQWEKESDTEILYIKDKNNYAELINGKWLFKGSFITPSQKLILQDAIKNPKLNIEEWVKNQINNGPILNWCQYGVLSKKQKNQWKQNTRLSDKLGLPYEYGFKVYRYYSVDGWINTSELNDICPKVDYNYAMNLCTNILKQYGFKVKIHKFKDNKPKISTTNDKQLKLSTTKVEQTFKTLHDVVYAIYEPIVEVSRGNNLNLAMVGTAYRMGYDVRETIDKVRIELGAFDSGLGTYNIPLKDDGYGYTKLVEIIGEEMANQYTKHLKELPLIKNIDIKQMKIEYMDLKPEVYNLMNDHFTEDLKFPFDRSFDYHFFQKEFKLDLSFKKHVGLQTNLKSYFEYIENRLINQYKQTDNYLDAKKEEKNKLLRDFKNCELNPFMSNLRNLQTNNLKNMLNDVELLGFNELVDLFIEIQQSYYFKNKEQVIQLLIGSLLLKVPTDFIVEVIGPSGSVKSVNSNIYTILYHNIKTLSEVTRAAFINEAINNPYVYDGEILLFDDLGAEHSNPVIIEFKHLLEGGIKELLSKGLYIKSKTDTKNNMNNIKSHIYTPNGFKLYYNAVESIVNTIRDRGQLKGRTEQIKLSKPISSLDDVEHKREWIKEHKYKNKDFNVFKLAWLKYIANVESNEISKEEFRQIYLTLKENGLDYANGHIQDRVDTVENYLYGTLGEYYYEYRFKPLYKENKPYRQQALKLLDIIKRHVEITNLENYNPDDKYLNLAKGKTSIRMKSRAGIDKFDGFTLEAIKGLNQDSFINSNYNRINDLIYWLVDNGYLYTDTKTKNGKNIYILLDD